jgi:hypothetical protein
LLHETIREQYWVISRRRRNKHYRRGEIGEFGGFDPIVEKGRWDNTVGRRARSICLSRIGKFRKGLMPKVIWWSNRLENYSVRASLLKDGNYFLVIKRYPRSLNAEDKHTYLAYRCGDAVGYTVLPKKAAIKDVNFALASLEPVSVKAAREKGHDVQIDWANQAFLIKSPRRKKVRSIPWKKHTRVKRTS